MQIKIFTLITFLACGSLNVAADSPNCKCVPDDDCWPSAAEFSNLNSTLSGRLIQSLPPASVCYSNQPNYNATACSYVLSHWYHSSFHAADSTSIGWPWWAHNSCPPIYPNGTSVNGDPEAGSKECSIGAYPAYAVNATEEAHVIAAVKFASAKNIRLNVKNTGHSFQGRSTAFGSLSVWTHHMRGFEYHEDFQVESGSPSSEGPQMAFTIAAGETVRSVTMATHTKNAVVVGGDAADVGIVGWFSGGGHGPLSSSYGLGVDNVLQVKIVAPDGVLHTANSNLNSDLFWALRGGGGGTFGVVTSVTMKAYPEPQTSFHTFSMTLANPANVTGFFDLAAFVVSELPRLKTCGLQGYSRLVPPGFPGVEAWTWVWEFYLYDKPNGTIETLFAPIAERLQPENGTTIVYSATVEHFPSFFNAWNASLPPESDSVATSGEALGSRLLPASSIIGNTKEVARVLQGLAEPAPGAQALLEIDTVTNNNAAMIKETSVTPAWRDAVLHLIVIDLFPDWDTIEEAQIVFNNVTNVKVEAFKKLAPGSGAYTSEADPFDPDWQNTFYGPNYPRLREIKKTVDPESMLWCLSCVGSEDWAEEDSGRLCKVS